MELWNAVGAVVLVVAGWAVGELSRRLAETRSERRRQQDRRDAYRRDLAEAILEGREVYDQLRRRRTQVADGQLRFDDIRDLFQHVAGPQRRLCTLALEHVDKGVRDVAEQCDDALWLSVAALQMAETSQHLVTTYSDRSDVPDEVPDDFHDRVEKWIANARDDSEEFKALVDRLAVLMDDQ